MKLVDIQTERVHHPSKLGEGQVGETGKKKLAQVCKNLSLGFKMPMEAIEGTYMGKACPLLV